jgi:hypothetical protein
VSNFSLGQPIPTHQDVIDLHMLSNASQSTYIDTSVGNETNSYLVQKIRKESGSIYGSGGSMPQGGTIMTDPDMKIIVDWITAGATY